MSDLFEGLKLSKSEEGTNNNNSSLNGASHKTDEISHNSEEDLQQQQKSEELKEEETNNEYISNPDKLDQDPTPGDSVVVEQSDTPQKVEIIEDTEAEDPEKMPPPPKEAFSNLPSASSSSTNKSKGTAVNPDASPTESNETDQTNERRGSTTTASKLSLESFRSRKESHELLKKSVSNESSLFRILIKFSEKAAELLPSPSYTENSFFSYIISSFSSEAKNNYDYSNSNDPALEAFSLLLSSLEDDNSDNDDDDDDHHSRNHQQARVALTAFVHLVSTWSHSRTHLNVLAEAQQQTSTSSNNASNSTPSLSKYITEDLLCMCIDTSQLLVAHGCLDFFCMAPPTNIKESNEPIPAIHILAESIFLSDLTNEKIELSALKFLLTTGCRLMEGSTNDEEEDEEDEENGDENEDDAVLVASSPQPMLRGTHLLQTIRVCYHIYLKTGSKPNKITARAALQQLVASVFVRMERSSRFANSISESSVAAVSESFLDTSTDVAGTDIDIDEKKKDGTIKFPSDDHRDAFLVLRSLCKLSMKTVPEGERAGANISYSSYYNSNLSNTRSTTWDTNTSSGFQLSNNGMVESSSVKAYDSLVSSTSSTMPISINPALESKILALELILYILSLPIHHNKSSIAPSINTNSLLTPSSTTSQNYANHLASSYPFQFAIRHYLCVSLLKNCTSNLTSVIELSLRIFVPLIRNFRSHLKTEIEAFVTNVFFVILDSTNSTILHKSLVVILFDEICSDPDTLAEIFLNYDCDLSAVDLFHRIVNSLAKVARSLEDSATKDDTEVSVSVGAMDKRSINIRHAYRQLRLDAMKALRKILASLHASIVIPMEVEEAEVDTAEINEPMENVSMSNSSSKVNLQNALEDEKQQQTDFLQSFDSKKKFREEQLNAILIFNRSPSKGIAYAGKCGHIDVSDPADVAKYLLKNGKESSKMEKAQIGEYLGKEPEYQDGFCLKVLHEYANLLDFRKMEFDDAIRFFLSGFRLPGEAQKIDRIMEKFAERFCLQNDDIFPTADAAFILAFAIIMLNTDLHNPAIKEERKMTKESFTSMNRGICDGGDLPVEMLNNIFDRIKTNPISLKEDDEARERAGLSKKEPTANSNSAISPAAFFGNHYEEMENKRESNFTKERDQIVRTTESLFRRKRRSSLLKSNGATSSKSTQPVLTKFVRTQDTGLRDQYVSPMFEATWGPALAVFSTALESANGMSPVAASMASDEEWNLITESVSEITEVCLSGFRLAICTAGLCGNETARGAFVRALYKFTLLGTSELMQYKHVRCIQALLTLAQEDGELLGESWEYVFRAFSELSRLTQVYETSARSGRNRDVDSDSESDDGSSEIFSDDDSDFVLEQDMDRRSIDKINSRILHEALDESLIDGIYQRSSSLSSPAVTDFILQLCRVSRMEIAGYGGHVGGIANQVDLDNINDRPSQSMFPSNRDSEPHHNQTNIYSLQKLVEVTHYNMESRPRLVFADIWKTVSAHLTSTALHSNAAVGMYAVDSFRQLSTQFLQREELGVFEFQRRFLKPLETVMAKSTHVSTKELLLKCIERIMLMFGVDSDSPSSQGKKPSKSTRGMLRSGWRPVLTVLALASHDPDDSIANMGFELLNQQLINCFKTKKESSLTPTSSPTSSRSLLTEHFVDVIDALAMFISCDRMQMSLKSIDLLIELSDWLADDSHPLPVLRRKPTISTASDDTSANGEFKDTVASDRSAELELWWPILLGLSQNSGDSRIAIREKCVKTLFEIINKHFFSDESDSSKSSDDLQTLQLIFRGVLISNLEHAETDLTAIVGMSPLPPDFTFFITQASSSRLNASVDSPNPEPFNEVLVNDEDMNENSWIVTTLGPLLDGAIELCLKSIEVYGDDLLVEEVLALLNSCLLSDSGALGIAGLRRLHKFITKDLSLDQVKDDTWAVVCHMLRRCLAVRGLPSAENDASSKNKEEYEMDVKEFKMEEERFSSRRYIGSNATAIIGTLLCNQKYVKSLGSRWCIFLINGLGNAINDWEQAATFVGLDTNNIEKRDPLSTPVPPHYLENTLYGRKWMTKLIVHLIEGDDTISAKTESCQVMLKNHTQFMINNFLEKEASLGEEASVPTYRAGEVSHLTKLVCDLLDGYNKCDDERLVELAWLCPLLSALIQSNNRTVRVAVHALVSRMFGGSMGSPSN